MINIFEIDKDQTLSQETNTSTVGFSYIKNNPITKDMDPEIISKINDLYNSTVDHERLFNTYSLVDEVIKEPIISNTLQMTVEVIKRLINIDYQTFIDIMRILSVILKEKDNKNRCHFIDNIYGLFKSALTDNNET